VRALAAASVAGDLPILCTRLSVPATPAPLLQTQATQTLEGDRSPHSVAAEPKNGYPSDAI
jgi:hypothetical protein